MVDAIMIARHRIVSGEPCFIIAEAGVNHNGDPALARQLIEIAAEAGANAVKFQTFNTEQLATRSAPKAEYQKEATDPAESQFDMLKRLELPPEIYHDLIAYAQNLGILFLSTPFDAESADFLETLGISAFKVSSGDLTNLPFLRYLAQKGKPLIVSTGMSYLGEVEAAVQALEEMGSADFALLHCVSNYPAAPQEINLRAMHTLAAAFAVPVGYSDHSLGIAIPLAAVALGAAVIEKHITIDCSLPGPDHRASLEPHDLHAMVAGIRTIEAALGDGRKRPAASEMMIAAAARKSLVANVDIPAGTVLTEQHITIKRPGTGLAPTLFPHLIGREARVAIGKGELLELSMVK